ncbi:MAG TPA: GAF domain-containing sensor histidine kinase, partial [Anaerolineae bacterium]|nr:GAF domain-containing sensor histidine kinase [Anaerolineae bacterium]
NIVPKEDLDEFKENFMEALAGKSVKIEKQVNIGNAARWFEFHYKPVFADGGQVIGVCFNTVNIDEQKQATAALAESEARLLAEMLSVLAINRALVSEIELDSLLEFIMAQAQHLMNAEGTSVLLLSDDEQQLKVATPGESWLHIKPGSLLPFQGSLAGLAMSQQQVQISNQAQVDERAGSIRALLQPYYQVRSLLCAPLIAQSRNLGILLVWSEREQNFTAQDGRLMSLFADQAALALHNAHLHMRNRQLAIEQERHRLAQDLHDSVTQSLYSIRLAAQASLKLLNQDTDSRPREAIEHIQSLSQAALIEMRKQIYDLYPTHQTSEGLVRALTHYCRVLRDEYSLAIDFTAGPEPPLSIYQRETLYGIAKEALWNVVKHAGATRVDVALARENDQIILAIKDNGAGFDPLFIRSEAMGLRSMEERTKLLDGNFELQSKPGQGTRLMVRIAISSM